MSRRSQWESMRREARSRVDDMDTKPFLETGTKIDLRRSVTNDSGGRSGLNTRVSEHRKSEDTVVCQQENSTGKQIQNLSKVETHMKKSSNSDNNDNTESVSDVFTSGPLFSVTVDDMSVMPITASSLTSDVVLDGKHFAAENTFVFREGILSNLNTTENGNSPASLQVELAQEKKKNIAAEQRLIELEKEVKVLRVENIRLASSEGEKRNLTTPSDISKISTRGNIMLKSGTQTHMEQIVGELQEELRLLKEYTRELESRLAEKSSALESRICELDQKEQRIRQLERTIADELIRRSKNETEKENMNELNNKSNISSNIQNESNKFTRDNVINNVVVPSIVHRSMASLRSHLDRERGDVHNNSQSLKTETNGATFAELPTNRSTVTPETSQQRVMSVRHSDLKNIGHTSVKHSKHSDANIQGDMFRNSLHQSSVASTALFSARRSSLSSLRRTGQSSSFSVLNSRHGDMLNTSIQSASSRPSSVTRKKTTLRVSQSKQRSKLKKKSVSPSPAPSLLKHDPHDDITALRSSSLRRAAHRPPPLETSMASTSSIGTNTAMLHHRDTRSIAPSVKSRPIIHHDTNGITTVQTLNTTVITRSVKRQESPVPEQMPRPDFIQFVPSNQPFVSEKFATTTYRPNRLVRCYKGDSGSRSMTPTAEEVCK